MPIKNYISPIQMERIEESERAKALLNAGIDLFGIYGIKGTTTRMLADESGSNSAAVTYYFGSKQGLYFATMDHIVDGILEMTNPFIEVIEEKLKSGLNKKEALDEFQNLMEGFCELFIEDNGLERWANIILREHASPTEAYDIFYDRYYKRTQNIMRELIGNVTDQDSKSDEVMILAHAIFGQTLGFLIARESLERGLKGKKIKKNHHGIMQETIRINIQAMLGRG
jgi:AcrR family transcriptional regulator